ncbi:hypothetical protein N7539_008590 [Penicillium diatomitis]|uniref:GP-PDE domain-containing protein n=1 Tax=Penicillium diatomitis TaxID=2819901 RepID=A0A9W9WQV2_9EURO|nr:uncharacterized protein N7539_008590 [Penicillium diatomitis]KAJ5472021.1 hypothetical protein N7539_008590 [Penicillium diatomitis]
MKSKVHFQEKIGNLNRDSENILTGAFCACCEELPSINPISSESSNSSPLDPFARERLGLEYAIRCDEPSMLATYLALSKVNDALSSNAEAILDLLLELSIIHHAGGSVQHLVSKAFPANGLIADHNLLNRMITRVGEENLLHDHMEQIQTRQSLCGSCRGGTSENTVDLAVGLMCGGQKSTIIAVNEFGRLPLHYSALCGLNIVCQKILGHAQDQGQASNLILSLDAQGHKPFYYAVAENHVAVAEMFLSVLKVEGQLSGQHGFDIVGHMQSLLNIAIRYQFDDIVALLGKSQFSEIGRDDYLKILLEIDNKAGLNHLQLPYGWSALTIACVKGRKKAAALLLQAGASQHIPDYRANPAGLDLSVTSDHTIINIGVLQNGKQGNGINPRKVSTMDKFLTGVSPPVDMSVSVGSGVSQLVHLPILSDMVNEPFIFPMHSSDEAHLVFKFYLQGSPRGKSDLICSAATLLRSEEDYLGSNRESLFRGRTIRILAKDSSELLGTVTFTFLIAKQPMDPKTSPLIDNYFSEQGTQLVGHRSSGQNTVDWSYLQLGENTIESMLSAAKQGASCVEFDVQLTRVLVPVVFHDFSLSKSGTDVPIHDLTFEQVCMP